MAATPRPANELRDAIARVRGHRRRGGPRRALVVGAADDAVPPGADRRRVVVRATAVAGGPGGLARPPLASAEAGTVHLRPPLPRRPRARRPSPTPRRGPRLPVAALRPAVAALEAAGELWHGTDERGARACSTSWTRRARPRTSRRRRGCSRCGTGSCSGHADRTRVIDPAHRSRIVAGQRRHLPDLPRRRPRGRPVVDAGHGERTRDRARAVRPAPRRGPRRARIRGGRARPDSSPIASRPPTPGTASAGIARRPAEATGTSA